MADISNTFNPDRYVSETASSNQDRPIPGPKLEIVTHDTNSSNKENYSRLAFSVTLPNASRGPEQDKADQESRIKEAWKKSSDVLGFIQQLKNKSIAENAVFAAKMLGDALSPISGLVGGLGKMFKG